MVQEKLQSSGFVSKVIRHGAGSGTIGACEGFPGVTVDIHAILVFADRIEAKV